MSSRTRRFGLSCPCGKITRIARIVHEGGFLKGCARHGFFGPAEMRRVPIRWARQLGLWHALDAADEGGTNLQEDGEPASSPAAARTYKARKHGPLSRH